MYAILNISHSVYQKCTESLDGVQVSDEYIVSTCMFLQCWKFHERDIFTAQEMPILLRASNPYTNVDQILEYLECSWLFYENYVKNFMFDRCGSRSVFQKETAGIINCPIDGHAWRKRGHWSKNDRVTFSFCPRSSALRQLTTQAWNLVGLERFEIYLETFRQDPGDQGKVIN